MKDPHVEELKTYYLNLRIEKTKKILDLGVSLTPASFDVILENQIIIMQALVDMINEMQKSH
jgi:hypothetical protein